MSMSGTPHNGNNSYGVGNNGSFLAGMFSSGGSFGGTSPSKTTEQSVGRTGSYSQSQSPVKSMAQNLSNSHAQNTTVGLGNNMGLLNSAGSNVVNSTGSHAAAPSQHRAAANPNMHEVLQNEKHKREQQVQGSTGSSRLDKFKTSGNRVETARDMNRGGLAPSTAATAADKERRDGERRAQREREAQEKVRQQQAAQQQQQQQAVQQQKEKVDAAVAGCEHLFESSREQSVSVGIPIRNTQTYL